MTMQKIKKLEKRIEILRKKIAGLGPMRPGGISKQYLDRANRRGSYYQLSYTHKGKSRTEHVWPEHVDQLKQEIAEYKKHKKLYAQLIELSIDLSKTKIEYLRDQNSA